MLTLISIIFSIFVVSSSTVFSVLWLVATFIMISLMLALLNLSFPALIYIIVYVGAIAILFLFVIQLLGTPFSVTTTIEKKSPVTLTFILSIAMASIIIGVSTTAETYLKFNSLFQDTLQIPISSSSQVESFAEWLYGPGLLPFILISVVLLVSMIAPIYLCGPDTKTTMN